MKRVSQPSMKEGLGTGELGAPSGDKGQWGLGFLLSTQHLALSTFKSEGRSLLSSCQTGLNPHFDRSSAKATSTRLSTSHSSCSVTTTNSPSSLRPRSVQAF
ncbi:MAG: hypothetical protein KME59_23335 [Trichormus sp. ATA11-4-KO1]|jgi:hypothetical protein|nr:hypothetical protein [Trichormus sp. ATA11-4-KO1]